MEKNFLLFLFPVCKKNWVKINKIIETKKIKIKKVKKIHLTEKGKFNLIKNLYKDEEWLGDINNNCDGLYYKLNSCFSSNDNELLIYFIKTNEEIMLSTKKQLRDLCKIGNHSIHTTDTDKEYNFLSKCYDNNNTIKLLNTIDNVNEQNFNNLFNDLKEYLKNKKINSNDICISGSSVLSIFNLRDCYDIDFLCLNDSIKKISDKIEQYNSYYLSSNFYKKRKISLKEIINNDKYHFYYDGLKFMTLELIKEFKELRNEEKDIKDIKLIEEILKNENYRY